MITISEGDEAPCALPSLRHHVLAKLREFALASESACELSVRPAMPFSFATALINARAS